MQGATDSAKNIRSDIQDIRNKQVFMAPNLANCEVTNIMLQVCDNQS